MSTEPTGVRDRNDQLRAQVDKTSFMEIARAFSVTIGPSLLLDFFAAAGTLALITGRIMRSREGLDRLLRLLAILGGVLPWADDEGVRPWHLR